MNPLQYTSKEMFSSTELIRKSKMVFDKLNKQEIEKAIILRDGKPSFMLLDFESYEKIMKEYLELKSRPSLNTNRREIIITEEPIKEIIQEKEPEKIIEKEPKNLEELDEKDLEAALAQIDELDLENFESPKEDDKKQPLKDFWD